MNRTIDEILDEIFEVLDRSTLLGAALDCMSDQGKQKLRSNIKEVIQKQ